MGVSLRLCVAIPPPKGETPLHIGTRLKAISPKGLSPNLVFKIPRITSLPGRFACQDLANTFGW